MIAPSQGIVFGLLINSALYLAGCFVAGLVLGVPLSWKLAVVTAAIAYLAYTAQQLAQYDGFGHPLNDTAHRAAFVLVLLSIATGAAAGLALLGI